METRRGELGVAVVGGGQGCLELIQLFHHFKFEDFKARIIGVADLCPDAPGMVYARSQGLMTTTAYEDFYSNPEVNVIIELTGEEEVLRRIYETKPPHIKVIDHVGARLFWDLMKLRTEQLSRNILESTRDAYLLVDSRGRLIHFNRAAERMLEPCGNLKVSSELSDLARAVFGEKGVEFLGYRAEGISLMTGFASTGREFAAEVSVFPTEIEEEECLVIALRDVSERLQAQQEIERLHRYEEVFSKAAACFALSKNIGDSINTVLTLLSECFGDCRVGLWKTDNQKRRLVLSFACPVQGRFYSEEAANTLTEKESPDVWSKLTAGEILRISNTGKIDMSGFGYWQARGTLSLLGVPVMGDGEQWGVLLVESTRLREWTDGEQELLSAVANIIEGALQREQAQVALRESEALYQAMVDKSLTGIYIIQDGVFLYVNRRMAEIFGYTEEELLNRNPLDVIVYPGDRWLVHKQLEARLLGEVPSVHYVFRGVTKEGKVIWLECMGAALTVRGRPAIIGNLMDITERVQNEEQRNRMFDAITMLAVGMVEQRDPYTAGHQRRVAAIATAIGKEMGLPEERIEGLRLAALLHDIGKFAIPIEILTKPGKLRPSEFEFIKLHSQLGAEILSEVPFPWDISTVVTQHHERLDGSGYPYGLRGEDICLEARIIAVADVVEAMSSHRPYRPSLGLKAALEEVKNNAGRLYDPDVVRALLKVADVIQLQ